MSDSEPDQILAEESDNPWVKLILWTQKDLFPAYRWNGFMKYLLEEQFKFLQPANLTEEQRLGVMKLSGADSAELMHQLPLLAADFNHALFKTMIPRFHGRNFHPGCHFHGVTWPEIPTRNGPKKLEDIIEGVLRSHIRSYEYIRIQAEKIGQLELRKEMIRRELACRAEAAKPLFERYLRKAYGWICNHGTSIGRPALALFGLWVFNFAAWQVWAAQEAALTTWDVIYHSGGRMLPLVSGHAYVEPETLNAIRAAPHVLHFFSACAAILSPFLLFLMALALRLKFRM